jgi:hypothetical protein
MRSLALALCVAVLGTGCIIHDDDNYDGYYDGPYGDAIVYWEFIRNAPAQQDRFVVYDSSLTGTATGPCPQSGVEWVRVISAAGTYDADCQTWNASEGVAVQGLVIGNLAAGSQTIRVIGYRGGYAVHDWSVSVNVLANSSVEAYVQVEPVQADAELFAYLATDASGAVVDYPSCAAAGNPDISYVILDGAETIVDEGIVGCTPPAPASDALPTLVYAQPLDLDNYVVRMQGIATSGPYVGQVVFESCGQAFDHFDTQVGANGIPIDLLTPARACPGD